MARRKSDPQLPPINEQPSRGVEPAPAVTSAPDHECMRCHKGRDGYLGEVTKDRFGWRLHASCRAVTEIETAPWR
jgi:hypothetical protein